MTVVVPFARPRDHAAEFAASAEHLLGWLLVHRAQLRAAHTSIVLQYYAWLGAFSRDLAHLDEVFLALTESAEAGVPAGLDREEDWRWCQSILVAYQLGTVFDLVVRDDPEPPPPLDLADAADICRRLDASLTEAIRLCREIEPPSATRTPRGAA